MPPDVQNYEGHNRACIMPATPGSGMKTAKRIGTLEVLIAIFNKGLADMPEDTDYFTAMTTRASDLATHIKPCTISPGISKEKLEQKHFSDESQTFFRQFINECNTLNTPGAKETPVKNPTGTAIVLHKRKSPDSADGTPATKSTVKTKRSRNKKSPDSADGTPENSGESDSENSEESGTDTPTDTDQAPFTRSKAEETAEQVFKDILQARFPADGIPPSEDTVIGQLVAYARQCTLPGQFDLLIEFMLEAQPSECSASQNILYVALFVLATNGGEAPDDLAIFKHVPDVNGTWGWACSMNTAFAKGMNKGDIEVASILCHRESSFVPTPRLNALWYLSLSFLFCTNIQETKMQQFQNGVKSQLANIYKDRKCPLEVANELCKLFDSCLKERAPYKSANIKEYLRI